MEYTDGQYYITVRIFQESMQITMDFKNRKIDSMNHPPVVISGMVTMEGGLLYLLEEDRSHSMLNLDNDRNWVCIHPCSLRNDNALDRFRRSISSERLCLKLPILKCF